MRREILPERPLRLSSRYRNNRIAVIALFGAMAGLVAFAFLALGIDDLHAYAREQSVWAHGKTCTNADYNLVVVDDNHMLAIRCDVDGARVSGNFELHTISHGELLAEGVGEVRYQDGDFAIELGITRMETRRAKTHAAMIVGCGIAVLFGGFGLLFWWRRFARVRRIARRGDEVTIEIVRVKPKMRGKHETHVRKVFWRHPVSGKLKKTQLDSKAGLAWLNSYEHKVLALRWRDDVLLLAGNLMPLDLERDRDAVIARLEKDGGGQPRGLPELDDWIVYSPPAPR